MADPRQGRRYVLRYHAAETPVAGPYVVIGRAPGCDIRVDDGAISRTHARLHLRGDGVWIEDLGSRNGVVIAGRPIGRKPVEIEVGAPFYLGNHRFTLGIEGKGRQDPTVETTSLGPAKVSQPGSRAAGDPAAPPSRAIPSTTATLDATEGMMLAGRAQLADAERPAAVRFSDALHVVQDLAAAGAEQKARLLLTEALDILASRPPMPELSPFLVASVRSMISRWSAHTDTPTWKQRVATLERWRRG